MPAQARGAVSRTFLPSKELLCAYLPTVRVRAAAAGATCCRRLCLLLLLLLLRAGSSSISCSAAHLRVALYSRLAVVTVPHCSGHTGVGRRYSPPSRRSSLVARAPVAVHRVARHCWQPRRRSVIAADQRCHATALCRCWGIRSLSSFPATTGLSINEAIFVGTCALVSPRRSHCRQSMQLHAHTISCCNHPRYCPPTSYSHASNNFSTTSCYQLLPARRIAHPVPIAHGALHRAAHEHFLWSVLYHSCVKSVTNCARRRVSGALKV